MSVYMEKYVNEWGDFKKGYMDAYKSCLELKEKGVFTEIGKNVSNEYEKGWMTALKDFESDMIDETGAYGPHSDM